MESLMRHTFLIQVHKNFEQIKNLVDYIISEDQCDVHIHVDLKKDLLYKELKKYYINISKVTVIDKRESVYWADFSQVKATLNLLKNAVVKDYDYYSLISGQDYMIKPLQEFNTFLENNKGLEFIETRQRNNTWRVKLAHRHTRHPKYQKCRYFRYYALILAILKYKKKVHIDRYKIYFGSQWFTITSDAVSYILEFLQNNPDFITDFETSTCGDEHFFQTILMNSEFKDKIYINNLRFIKFKFRSNSPVILTLDDYSELVNSSKFIARKFDIEVSREIIQKIKKSFNIFSKSTY